MKKNKYYIIPLLLMIFIGFMSCNDTYEFHEKYIQDGETIYTNKVDSLTVLSGDNRVQIDGYISNAFNVEKITAFWDKGKESQTFNYEKSSSDTDKIELIIVDLEEKSYEFEVFSYDSDGNASVKVITFGTAYGENFRSNLKPRGINAFSLGADHNATVNLKPAFDVTRATEIKFTNLSGQEIVNTILAEESESVLEQVDMANPVMYRTFYVPSATDKNGSETSIDEFDSDWATYQFPSTLTAVFTSILLESISGGVIANWENSENVEFTFDFINMDKQDNEVINTLISAELTGTYTFTAMKVEEQEIEIRVADILGNSKSMFFTVTPLQAAGKGNWSIVDVSTEEAGGEGPTNGYATAAIDGDTGTFWHSNWSSTGSSYPHHLTIDMGAEKNIAGFEIFRRSGQGGGATVHEFWVSSDNVTFTKVSTLNAALNSNDGFFTSADVNTTGRYVKYVAIEGPNSFTYLGEINVIERLDNSDWSIVDFSTEEAGGEGPTNGYATAAIDGDTGTFWHSNWSSTGSSYPHHLTIDLGSEKSIASFEIFRRSGQGGGATIHEFWVSSDNVTFTKVATLNAALNSNDGFLTYADAITKGRYVKYVAIEGPNSFTYLGEIKIYGVMD